MLSVVPLLKPRACSVAPQRAARLSSVVSQRATSLPPEVAAVRQYASKAALLNTSLISILRQQRPAANTSNHLALQAQVTYVDTKRSKVVPMAEHCQLSKLDEARNYRAADTTLRGIRDAGVLFMRHLNILVFPNANQTFVKLLQHVCKNYHNGWL